ncbi:hypothetical protein [Moorena sp. SIO4G3]|uniref:hypothetical protein n=1 Tax=Moorena sp. SIO4G3 TaxID=2607821 RepID=UPI00142AF0FC|nr:hypothetical protein [Moorena sp. SIO4G3]NEO75176.1 hypothetical protein [Moorena sp. SIO4G3]
MTKNILTGRFNVKKEKYKQIAAFSAIAGVVGAGVIYTQTNQLFVSIGLGGATAGLSVLVGCTDDRFMNS